MAFAHFAGQLGNGNFTSVFGDLTSFRAKGSRQEPGKRHFTSVFGDRTSFRAKGLRREPGNRNLFLATEPHFVRKSCDGGNPEIAICFWRSNLISCERVAWDDLQIAILHQFLAIKLHFVRKGCAGRLEIAILHQFLAIEPHFVRKGCAGGLYLSFWRSNLISCERVARDDLQIAILPQFLATELHFVRKALALPRAFKREKEKKERARGQEDKRRRCEDVRM